VPQCYAVRCVVDRLRVGCHFSQVMNSYRPVSEMLSHWRRTLTLVDVCGLPRHRDWSSVAHVDDRTSPGVASSCLKHSASDMVMGPNFSTQSNATHYVADIDPTQPISPDYNSITPNTGCYNAINRETVITSLKNCSIGMAQTSALILSLSFGHKQTLAISLTE